jgi:hypothetical protein
MINRKILNNILKSITAGKEEFPQSISAPPTTPEENVSEQSEQNINKPVQRWRYYFFDAPPENSIKFSYISEILKSDTPERTALIEKLQGGNSGKYFADYFRWTKIIIATNQYSPDGKSLVVYEANLNPMGTKVAGSERIYPEKSNATVENFETDLILFSDKRGNSGVINIDNSGESFFSDQDPPNNIVNVLLNRTRPAGKFINYNEFIKIFDEYRVWATSLNQLLLPNFDVPTNDDVPGGHYVGGQAAFNQVVGKIVQEIQQKKQQSQQPSLKDKVDNQFSVKNSPFEPVDEQNKDKVQGQELDKPTGSPMAKKFSVKDYKIKRMARNVLAEYIEEDTVDKDALTTGTTVKGIGGNPVTDDAKFKALATKSRTEAKKYDEMAQLMKQFKSIGTP